MPAVWDCGTRERAIVEGAGDRTCWSGGKQLEQRPCGRKGLGAKQLLEAALVAGALPGRKLSSAGALAAARRALWVSWGFVAS